MPRKIGFSTHPVIWANLIVLLITYASIIAFALWDGRKITFSDVMFFWPIHLMLLINLFGIFGPAGKKKQGL